MILNSKQIRRSDAFQQLTDDQLYLLFSDKQWNRLNPAQKQLALQEIECRMASKQGREACPVVLQKIDCEGFFNPNTYTITLNEKHLVSGRSVFSAKKSAAGALDTILHEGRHAMQHAVVTGRCSANISPRTRRTWLYNKVSYAGTNFPGVDHYTAFALYAFQPIERDAREYAGRELSAIYQKIQALSGDDNKFFTADMTTMLKYKAQEYRLVRNTITPEVLMAFKLYQSKRFTYLAENADRFLVGEGVTMAQAMATCEATKDTFDEMANDQLTDFMKIMRAEAGIDNYLDGFDTALGIQVTNLAVKTSLDQLIGKMFKPLDTAKSPIDRLPFDHLMGSKKM